MTPGSQFDGFILTYEPGDGQLESPIRLEKDVVEILLEGLNAMTSYMIRTKTFSGKEYLLPSESDALSVDVTGKFDLEQLKFSSKYSSFCKLKVHGPFLSFLFK